MLKGGISMDNGKTYALNVIPIEAEAGFDIRISPHMKIHEFKVCESFYFIFISDLLVARPTASTTPSTP